MNNRLAQLNLNSEEKILSSRVEDFFSICERKNIPKFSGFLDLRQQKIALYTASGIKSSEFEFFGGYPGAERKMLGVFPDYITGHLSEFPIGYLEFMHSRKLSHRDFLGSLMSLGIKREIVGDIIVGEKKSYIIVQKSFCSHIIDNMSKIGNVGITVSECTEKDIVLVENCFDEDSIIVSSMRVDCVAAALLKISRADSAKFINSERVRINHEIADSCSKNVNAGDVLSICGVGKFIVGECTSKTKKGRFVLSYKKYI